MTAVFQSGYMKLQDAISTKLLFMALFQNFILPLCFTLCTVESLNEINISHQSHCLLF